jgi:hypothetical protein
VPGSGLNGRQRHAVENQIAIAIREGVPLHRIAPAVGVATNTINWWLQEARHGNPTYQRFARTYADARAERQARVDELLADARRATRRAFTRA